MKGDTRLANEAWEALFRAQATMARDLLSQDVWGGLVESEYGVLYALSNAPQGLRMSELANDVLLSQAGLSRLVGRLEAKGLIERQSDPEDGRASVLRLSAAGLHKQRRVGAAHGRQVSDRVSACLNPDEMTILRDLCRRLAGADGEQSGDDNERK